jgi:dTDP-4-amino-4,6-dideoxygalactose transaminase
LERLPEQAARRTRNARYLMEQFGRIEGIRPVEVDSRVTQHAWHVFILRYQAEAFGGLHRDDFIRALNAEGIPCGRGYLPLTRSEAIIEGLASLGAGAPSPCPLAEQACDDEAIYLTQNMLLGSTQDMDSIVEAVVKIQRAKGG